MPYRLEVAGLSCTRGDRPLFAELDFAAASGELLHVVGSNGSGKTTLLRTVCGLTRPAAGKVRWQGETIQQLGDQYRRHIAYVGHLDGIQGELTPAENLAALACHAGAGEVRTPDRPPIDAALERLGLARLRAFPAKVLSQGQKRRLALARLLLSAKPLWILDEPFTALDTHSSALLNVLLAEHLARGGIALLASHQPLAIPGADVRRLDLEHAGERMPRMDAAAVRPLAAGREQA